MLISEQYKLLNQNLHNSNINYGNNGYKIAEEIIKIYNYKNSINSILDYGSGKGSLKKELIKLGIPEYKIQEYDPCILEKCKEPSKSDLVICSDVMEHIEYEFLDNVLDHIFSLINKKVYFKIATRLSDKYLENGKNAHLIVEKPIWWQDKLLQYNWKKIQFIINYRKDDKELYGKEIIAVGEKA